MNIKRAKQEIENTLRAYLSKDELGNYRIPSVRQRPVLLMGPPGIGKTQIMEQIASETGVGLVAYTITHHTRQSAIGLPFIEKRVYGGAECSVTEYTMSEILASVYDLMEKTGLREGILFLDEINCVSETLTPMMLQFLQCKTFGNRKLPEGWLIVAAGNPPEYNKSVRDFDVVTLDRVKRIDVEEDFSVWKEYAVAKGLHGAVISYLDIKKENFYRIEQTQNGMEFVTARGWEDLSELLFTYEALGLPVDAQVCVQYLQMPHVARDFAGYLKLYRKYQESYHIEEILKGSWHAITEREFSGAPFDEKLSVMGLLYTALAQRARQTREQEAFTDALHEDLTRFKNGEASLSRLCEEKADDLRRRGDAGQLTGPLRNRLQKEIATLTRYESALAEKQPQGEEEAMDLLREAFAAETETLRALSEETGNAFDNAFRFLESSVPASQEMVIFVTEVTAGADSSWFVEHYGCEAYFRNNRELLFDEEKNRILGEIRA